MKKARFDTGRFVQGLILFGFNIYLIKMFQTNEINKLVSPHIATLLKITLAVLLVMTFYALGTIFTRSRDCDHEHEHDCDHDHDHHHHYDHGHSHRPKPRIGWLLLAFPVMLGMIVPTQSLNASMMTKGLLSNAKGNAQMAFGQKSTPQVTVEKATDVILKEEVPPPAIMVQPQAQPKPQAQGNADVPYIDMSTVEKVDIPADQKPPKPTPGSELSVVELFSNILVAPDYYYNQRYIFTGFVYHPAGWPTDRLILTRYLISCCAADATPIGIVVQSKDAAKYADSTWLKVDSTVSAGKVPGAQSIPPISWYYGLKQSPILYAKTIQTIPEPADPYEMPKPQM